MLFCSTVEGSWTSAIHAFISDLTYEKTFLNDLAFRESFAVIFIVVTSLLHNFPPQVTSKTLWQILLLYEDRRKLSSPQSIACDVALNESLFCKNLQSTVEEKIALINDLMANQKIQQNHIQVCDSALTIKRHHFDFVTAVRSKPEWQSNNKPAVGRSTVIIWWIKKKKKLE